MDVPGTMRAVRIAEHGGPEVLQPSEVAVPRRGRERCWSGSPRWR